MEKDNKALTVKQDNSVFEGKNYYCSVSLHNDQGQVLVYNALESCDVRVADSIGQTIELKDVYIEKYMKEKDGESKEAIRTILSTLMENLMFLLLLVSSTLFVAFLIFLANLRIGKNLRRLRLLNAN